MFSIIYILFDECLRVWPDISVFSFASQDIITRDQNAKIYNTAWLWHNFNNTAWSSIANIICSIKKDWINIVGMSHIGCPEALLFVTDPNK